METDGSNVYLSPVPLSSEAGTPPPGELVQQLRTEVSTLREHTKTANVNHVAPYAYLKTTLVATAHGHPASKLDQLLPWAFNSASRRNPGAVGAYV